MLLDFFKGGLDAFNQISATNAAEEEGPTTKAEALAKKYDPYRIKPDETLVEYYKRLAELREGGILGTSGLMDVPVKDKKKAVASSDIALGEETINRNYGSANTYVDDDIDKPGRGASLEDMVRAKSGAGFDPLQLFGILGGPLGSAVAMGGGMLRDSAIGKALEAMGYSEAEIEAMMADPGLMQMELSMNPSAGFGKDWEKSDLKDGTTMVERLFGDIFGKEERSAPESLMMASARRSPYSNVTGFQNGMFTANIDGVNRGFTPGVLPDQQQYWMQESQRQIAERQKALEDTMKANQRSDTGYSGSYSSPSDSVSAGRTSSSDISYSSSRDRSSTTGYDLNKD